MNEDDKKIPNMILGKSPDQGLQQHMIMKESDKIYSSYEMKESPGRHTMIKETN
jgi:hypothetical protein